MYPCRCCYLLNHRLFKRMKEIQLDQFRRQQQLESDLYTRCSAWWPQTEGTSALHSPWSRTRCSAATCSCHCCLNTRSHWCSASSKIPVQIDSSYFAVMSCWSRTRRRWSACFGEWRLLLWCPAADWPRARSPSLSSSSMTRIRSPAQAGWVPYATLPLWSRPAQLYCCSCACFW